MRVFPGLTRLEAWRENGKGVRKVSDVSRVARFGGTEGVRLRERARLGEFPKLYARIEYGMIRTKQKGGKAAFYICFLWVEMKA